MTESPSIPPPDIDHLLQERLTESTAKVDSLVTMTQKNLAEGYDDLTIFVSVGRAVETVALMGPQMLNEMIGTLAAAIIKIAKAQMEE